MEASTKAGREATVGCVAVDYFAGAGGWTCGVEQAGVRVAAAVNHWPRAVETHRANHPGARHYCQDASLLDPADLPEFDTLIASPSCTGHTHARGKEQPRHDASRATAWCVVNTAEVRRPQRVLVENVPEFRAWALYPAWRAALEALGYALSENVLDASDFGVPQERVRLFVVGVLGERRAPRIVPPRHLFARTPTARDVIDLDAGEWSPVAGKKPSTQIKIADGRRRFGRAPFLICYYGSGSGRIARSLDRPLGTITTLDRWAIVDGDRMRMLSVEERRRAMGFPSGYILTGNRREQGMQLGNAVCPPVAAEVIRQVVGVGAGAAREAA